MIKRSHLFTGLAGLLLGIVTKISPQEVKGVQEQRGSRYYSLDYALTDDIMDINPAFNRAKSSVRVFRDAQTGAYTFVGIPKGYVPYFAGQNDCSLMYLLCVKENEREPTAEGAWRLFVGGLSDVMVESKVDTVAVYRDGGSLDIRFSMRVDGELKLPVKIGSRHVPELDVSGISVGYMIRPHPSGRPVGVVDTYEPLKEVPIN